VVEGRGVLDRHREVEGRRDLVGGHHTVQEEDEVAEGRSRPEERKDRQDEGAELRTDRECEPATTTKTTSTKESHENISVELRCERKRNTTEMYGDV
jgi:hypothetical protein